jgi:hypothetical protein
MWNPAGKAATDAAVVVPSVPIFKNNRTFLSSRRGHTIPNFSRTPTPEHLSWNGIKKYVGTGKSEKRKYLGEHVQSACLHLRV